MVHPLVIDTDRTFNFCQMRNRILRKHRNTITIDQIRNTMVDLRINMVRTTCKNNSSSAGIFKILKSLLALRLYILTHLCKLFPCRMCCCFYFISRDILKHLYQTVCQNCLRCKCHKRIHKPNIRVLEFIHVILDVFCIGSNDRAVIMIDCIRKLITLIRHARIENKFHAFFDQPADMSMCKLCRITFGFTRNRLNTQLINLSG